jgi:hypothetical protein
MVADTGTMSLHDSVFQQYVRANLDWHQRRLDEGGFRVIVALGGLAYDEARRFAGRSVRVLKVRHPAAWEGPRTVDAAPALRAALLASNAIVAANLPDFAAKAAEQAAEKVAALAAIEPLRVTLPETVFAAMVASVNAQFAPKTVVARKVGKSDFVAPDGSVRHNYTRVDANDSRIITLLTNCPIRKSEGKGVDCWNALRDGMTLRESIKAGCTRSYVQWFTDRGAIALDGLTGADTYRE